MSARDEFPTLAQTERMLLGKFKTGGQGSEYTRALDLIDTQRDLILAWGRDVPEGVPIIVRCARAEEAAAFAREHCPLGGVLWIPEEVEFDPSGDSTEIVDALVEALTRRRTALVRDPDALHVYDPPGGKASAPCWCGRFLFAAVHVAPSSSVELESEAAIVRDVDGSVRAVAETREDGE